MAGGASPDGNPNILIVDDEVGARESLRIILKPFYKLYFAEDANSALALWEKVPFDLVTLDLKMHGMSGIELLRLIKKSDPDIAVIIITGYGTMDSAVEAIRQGVFDFFTKPFNIQEVKESVKRAVQKRRITITVKKLFTEVMSAGLDKKSETLKIGENIKTLLNEMKAFVTTSSLNKDLLENEEYLEFVKVLANTLERKDTYTTGHSERVSYYSQGVGEALNLSRKEIADLQFASYLHDIGKLGISNSYIYKKSELSNLEWEIIKNHPVKGIEIIAPLNLPCSVALSVRNHHERYDGTGYPDGLRGEEIPFAARAISICDAFDAMTSNRSYRDAWGFLRAKEELMKNAETHFDPKLLNDSVFASLYEAKNGLSQ